MDKTLVYWINREMEQNETGYIYLCGGRESVGDLITNESNGWEGDRVFLVPAYLIRLRSYVRNIVLLNFSCFRWSIYAITDMGMLSEGG